MSTALTVQEPSQALSLREILSEVVKRPELGPEGLHSVLDFQERLEQREAKREFNTAFLGLKDKLPTIAKNGVVLNKNGGVQFRYAKYDDLHKAMKPLLAEFGFATAFDFEEPATGRLKCVMRLKHSGGHEETFSWTLPAAGQNNFVSNLQNAAAARSFAKRCVMIDAFDVLTEDTDTDGVMRNSITEEQANNLDVALAEFGESRGKIEGRLLTVYQVTKVADIQANCYKGAISMLEQARRGGK